VNVLAEPKGSGFIWGTEPEISLVSGLASAGIPLGLVALAPQAAAMLALGLVVLAPFGFRGSRTTATLAASLALGGGLWPGPVPYGSVLLRPSALLLSGMLLGGLWLLGRAQAARRAFHRFRLEIAGGLVAAATLDRALAGGAEPGATAALLLSGAAMILASPLRAALRRISSSAAMARRAEALCLLCSFGGSGLLWWDPPHSVAGFNEARDENASLQESMGWIRRNVPKNAVVLASPEYSAPIAAFGGRRVLFPPPADAALISLREPFRRTRLSESTRLGQPLARLAEAFSVTHLFLGPGEIDPPARTEASGTTEARLKLELVYQDARDFRVFRLARK
jgi:hypothetical protein